MTLELCHQVETYKPIRRQKKHIARAAAFSGRIHICACMQPSIHPSVRPSVHLQCVINIYICRERQGERHVCVCEVCVCVCVPSKRLVSVYSCARGASAASAARRLVPAMRTTRSSLALGIRGRQPARFLWGLGSKGRLWASEKRLPCGASLYLVTLMLPAHPVKRGAKTSQAKSYVSKAALQAAKCQEQMIGCHECNAQKAKAAARTEY